MSKIAFAVAMVGVLAIAGCTPADEEPDAPLDETTTDSVDAPEDEPSDPTDPSCLIGDWEIAQAELQSYYDVVSGEVDGVTFGIEGGTGLSFTATEYRYTPGFTLLLEIDGATSGEGTATGSLGGTYTAEDGVITTELADNDLSVVVTVLGQTIDGSDLAGGFLQSDPINQAPFDCSSGTPVLQFETSSGRTPVALTPAG